MDPAHCQIIRSTDNGIVLQNFPSLLLTAGSFNEPVLVILSENTRRLSQLLGAFKMQILSTFIILTRYITVISYVEGLGARKKISKPQDLLTMLQR